MAQWTVSTYYKKSCQEVETYHQRNGDGKVTVPEVLAGLAAGGTAASTPVASTATDPSTSNSVPDVSNLLSAYGYSAAPVAGADPTVSSTPTASA